MYISILSIYLTVDTNCLPVSDLSWQMLIETHALPYIT